MMLKSYTCKDLAVGPFLRGTMFCVPVKPQPKYRIEKVLPEWADDYPQSIGYEYVIDRGYFENGKLLNKLIKSPYVIGDVLWLRETYWQDTRDKMICRLAGIKISGTPSTPAIPGRLIPGCGCSRRRR